MVEPPPPTEVIVPFSAALRRSNLVLVAALLAMLLVPVSSGPARAQTPSPETDTVQVSPDHGRPGDPITIEGCLRWPSDMVKLTWDGAQLGTTAPVTNSCYSAQRTVPAADPGRHIVEAISGDSRASTAFTVDAPTSGGGDQPPPSPSPTLTLDPSDVVPGDTTDAAGCRYPASSSVTLSWPDGRTLATTTAGSDGCIQATVTVPDDAVAGSHRVTAGSSNGSAHDTVTVHAVFLRLGRTSGGAGTTAGAVTCGWPVQQELLLRWDDGSVLSGGLTTDGQGCVTGQVGIPADAAPGDHTVTAAAKTLGVEATATFSVTPPLRIMPYLRPLPPPTVQLRDIDLFPSGVEFTQGIQCFDTSEGLTGCADNSLPLVLGRTTAIRIYLGLGGRTREDRIDDVPVRFHYRHHGGDWVTVDTAGPALRQPDRGDADATANLFLTVSGSSDVDIDYWVEVDPDHTVSQLNRLNERYPDSGYAQVTFQQRRGLDILGQPIDYHPSGYTGTRTPGGWAVSGGAALWLEQILPVPTGSIDYRTLSGTLDWTQTLTGSVHDLIPTLNGVWVLAQVFSQALNGRQFPLDHLYGWVPAPTAGDWGHADMPVYPHAGGYGVVAVGTDGPGTDTDNPGPGALIFGHELVHDYDIKHTDTPDACNSKDPSSPFPYSSSSIQEYGFNPVTRKVYDPANTHDLMSYCPAQGKKQGWISPYTWSQMFAALAPGSGSRATLSARSADAGGTAARTPQAVSSSDGTLVVATTIQREGGGSLGDTYLSDATPAIDEPPAGDLAVELRDDTGNVVARRTFGVDFSNEYGDGHGPVGPGHTGPYDQATIQLTLPWDTAAAEVVLLDGSQVLDRRTVSANAPTVTVTAPSTPTTWHAHETAEVSWRASDPDGDALTYALLYSHDAGASWTVLARHLTATRTTLAVDDLAGGDAARFRVVASDGVRTATADSAAVSIPGHAPTATILSPAADDVIARGDLAVLTGGAVDREDGRVADASLTWTSDRDGPLGAGSRVTTSDLSAGTHTITLTATDADGVTGTDTVRLTVAGATEPTLDPDPATVGEAATATSRAIAGTDRIIGCTVDYGDGAAPAAGVLDGHVCRGPAHTYRDAGEVRVVVTFVGAEGPLVRRGVTVTVADAPLPLVTRLAGSNRFATAATIARERFDAGVPVAYVATGGSFADALAGVPAAGLAGGPILLVTRDRIPSPTAAELRRLRPGRIVVLGGTAAVGAGVADQLAAYTDGGVTRLAGSTRFATAAAIATATFDGPVPTAYVATGTGFADALAGGPLATSGHGPVLLTARDWLPGPTRDALLDLEPGRIVVLGGAHAVSDEVLARLRDLTDGEVARVAGSNRFTTATDVSARAFADGSAPVVYVATGGGFADALAGGPVAALLRGPVLLVGDTLPDVVRRELDRLAPRRIVVLGGPAAVPESVVAALREVMRGG